MLVGALLLLAFVFVQCVKEDPEVLPVAESESVTPDLALAIDAATFVQLFENEETNFCGIFAKITDGQLVFEKMDIVQNKFVASEMTEQPTFSTVLIAEDGTVLNVGEDAYSLNDVLGYSEVFELAYFNWKDLKMIAANSENLYLTGMTMTYGASIHSNAANDQSFSSFKIEGDFGLVDLEEGFEMTALGVVGHPCPPFWGDSN